MDIEPLPVPRMDYVSAAPYTVTLEWADSVMSTKLCSDLKDALFTLFDPDAPIAEAGAPDRRVLIDARGITILGYIEDPFAEVCHVITTEVANELRSIGMDEQDILELELEMMIRTEEE